MGFDYKNFKTCINVYTKNGDISSFSGSRKQGNNISESKFNVDIKDALKCPTVPELVSFLYSAVYGNNHKVSSKAKSDFDNFEFRLMMAAKEMSDVISICFVRKFESGGDFRTNNALNDKELCKLASAYYVSQTSEDKKNLETYVNGIHPSNIWSSANDDSIYDFARKSEYDQVGYYWPKSESLDELALWVGSSWPRKDWGDWKLVREQWVQDKYVNEKLNVSIPSYPDCEYGYEFEELDFSQGIFRKIAFMDLGLNHSSDEDIYKEIRRRVTEANA